MNRRLRWLWNCNHCKNDIDGGGGGGGGLQYSLSSPPPTPTRTKYKVHIYELYSLVRVIPQHTHEHLYSVAEEKIGWGGGGAILHGLLIIVP